MSAILDRAKKYSAEIQKRSRAQQLAWFGEQFDIGSETLLRLVGYSPAEIKRQLASGATVVELAKKKLEGTIWVTELFRELVAKHGYEVDGVARSFREPVRDADLPPVSKGLGKAPAPLKRVQKVLFRKVKSGGPQVYTDLTNLIRAVNESGTAHQPTPAKKRRPRRPTRITLAP